MLNLEFIRFLLVGVLNTLVGFSIIFLLVYYNIDNYVANFTGYFIGLIVSFLLHRNFTFRSKTKKLQHQIIFFIIFFIIAYLVNIFILSISLEYYDKYIAQFLAICGYTITNYILNKLITFKE